MPLLWEGRPMSEKTQREMTSLCHRFAIMKSIQVDTTRTQNPSIYARITLGSLGK